MNITKLELLAASEHFTLFVQNNVLMENLDEAAQESGPFKFCGSWEIYDLISVKDLFDTSLSIFLFSC